MLGGTAASFRGVPNGIPGLETRLPLLFSEGVGKGRIDLQAFVALTPTNPARMCGLYPRKGTIAVGSDANIVIWDDNREVTIRNDMLHHKVDYTPYEDPRITGWPRAATPGKPRPPPAGGSSEAGKATAVAPDARPLVLGYPFPPLAALARGAGDRKAGNRHRLAPEGISCVLDLEFQAP